MESTNTPKSYQETYSFEKRKRKEFYEKQSQLFQNVLAHVDEQVSTQMDKVSSDLSKVLMIYTGNSRN